MLLGEGEIHVSQDDWQHRHVESAVRHQNQCLSNMLSRGDQALDERLEAGSGLVETFPAGHLALELVMVEPQLLHLAV